MQDIPASPFLELEENMLFISGEQTAKILSALSVYAFEVHQNSGQYL